MYLIYFLLITIICYYILFSSQVENDGNIGLKFNAPLVFIVIFYLHSIALPISRVFFNSYPELADFDFMYVNVLCWIGILLSSILFSNEYLKTTGKVYIIHLNTFSVFKVKLFLVITAFWNFYSIFKNLDFNPANLLQQYGFEMQFSTGEVSIFDSVRELLFFSAVGLSYIIGNEEDNKPLKKMATILCFSYFVLILLRGSRNAATMMLFPVIVYYFKTKLVSIRNVVIVTFVLFLGGYLIGVIRNYGFSEVTGIQYSNNMFDPLAQEFGTSFSVFSKWLSMQSKIQYQFGRTYIIDPLTNFIPTAVWPNRPPSSAINFSMLYFDVVNKINLVEGLGYSPIVEALSNFGYFGLIPVFFIFWIIIRKISNYFDKKATVLSNVLYGFFCVFSLNFTRIDFSTSFKMFFLFLLCAGLMNYIIKKYE